MTENDRAFIRHIAITSLEFLGRRVVQLLASDPEKQIVKPLGSGTLLKVNDRRFIITARHILDEKWRGRSRPCILDYEKTEPLIPLAGLRAPYLRLKEDDGRVPKLDIGLIELSEEVVAKIPNRCFCNLGHVDLTQHLDGLYFLYGYVSEGWKVDKSASILRVPPGRMYFTNLSPRIVRNCDPRFDLLLHAPIEDSETIDGKKGGRPMSFAGASGCSIWRVNQAAGSIWKPDDMKIVGVQSSEYEGALLKGVRWLNVIVMMASIYKDLRGAMKIAHPDIESMGLDYSRDFKDLLDEMKKSGGVVDGDADATIPA